MADDAIPKDPTHVAFRISKSLDRVRGTISKLGLRPYRVFFVRMVFDPATEEMQGIPDEAELSPAPRVRRFAPRNEDRGGIRVEGSLRLDRISRHYRREELLQRGIWEDDSMPDARLYYALIADGQIHADLYKPSGEPILEPFGWSLALLPVNRTLRLRAA